MNNESAHLEKGNWSDKIRWEFYVSSILPPVELCTAVFCVAITSGGGIVLTRVARGWGILGGHIEDGETVIGTLIREAQEEGGFTPTEYHLLGYRKIISTEPIQHQNLAKTYPYPTGYIIYFWATSKLPLGQSFGEEVFEAAEMTLEEAIRRVDTSSSSIIKLAYDRYVLKE